MMMKSKGVLAAGSVAGILILVYGTALLFRLLFGAYLFEGGLTSLNYALLVLLCAAPFVVMAVIGRNTSAARRSIVLAALLFTVLFVLFQLVLVQSAGTLDGGAVIRTLVIFPVTALLLAVVLYFEAGREKAV